MGNNENQGYNVTEVCPTCGREIQMRWDTDTMGFKAFCPACGGRLMLCDECQRTKADSGKPAETCDYCKDTDTCRWNQKPKTTGPITVKLEWYYDDAHRRIETKQFQNLTELEDWMFSQMACDYTSDRNVMFFPSAESVKRINAKGPGAITLRPTRDGWNIWLHKIEDSRGIVFSDGHFTAGHKHWSEDVQAWLSHCEERRCAPQFNFVK